MTGDVATINKTRPKTMPIFNVTIESFDKKAREAMEMARVGIYDINTIRRPDLGNSRKKFARTKDKEFT